MHGPHLAHPQPVLGDKDRKYVYSLRIINPKRMSFFEMKKFTSESQFQFPGELRSCIKEEFSMVVPESDNFSLGWGVVIAKYTSSMSMTCGMQYFVSLLQCIQTCPQSSQQSKLKPYNFPVVQSHQVSLVDNSPAQSSL